MHIEKNDISACHRVKKSKDDPIIIVKFVNRKTKEELMVKRKSLKGKTAGSLKLTDDETKMNGKIFINESLTKMNRDLFRSVRLQCEERVWKFFWAKNGVIFARKDKDTATARISNLVDLEEKII